MNQVLPHPEEIEKKGHFPIFGGKRELEAEVERLQGLLNQMGFAEREQLQIAIAQKGA